MEKIIRTRNSKEEVILRKEGEWTDEAYFETLKGTVRYIPLRERNEIFERLQSEEAWIAMDLIRERW